MLPEVKMARVLDAIGLHHAGRLSCGEAAELLGLSERHFRRLRDAYEAEGVEGLVDRRRGRVSGRRADGRFVLASSGHIAGIINPPGGKGNYCTRCCR